MSSVVVLDSLATIPWDKPPNFAPCSSWLTCGRHYEIVEYEVSNGSWTELRRIPAFEISISDYRLHV